MLMPSLSKALQRVATYMLDNPGDIATLSMRKIAENTGVSVPNFDRLAKSLGFSTYGELRELYRERVQRDSKVDYHLRAETLQQSGEVRGLAQVWSDGRSAALSTVNKVYDTLSATDLDRVASLLVQRRRIFVAGAQASRSAATYLDYVGTMASPQFSLLGRTGGLYADDLAEMTDEDALIVIAIRPCARASVEVARIARERGCVVVGITDSFASPLARYCDEILLTPTDSPMFFESYLGTVAIIEALLSFLTLKLGKDVAPRIERIESDRRQLGEYWQD